MVDWSSDAAWITSYIGCFFVIFIIVVALLWFKWHDD